MLNIILYMSCFKYKNTTQLIVKFKYITTQIAVDI